MDITLKTAAPLSEELHAVFHRLVLIAKDSIDQYPEYDSSGLHNARKCLKRLRGLLRMIDAPQLKSECRELNSELRKAAILLHLHRDNEVLVEFFSGISSSLADGKGPILRKALNKILGAEASILIEAPTQDNFHKTRKRFKRILKDADRRFGKMKLKKVKWAHLEKALLRTRKRMRKSGKAYRRNANPDTLHEWRKRLKDNFYQQLILKEYLNITDAAILETEGIETRLGLARDCDLALESLTTMDKVNLSAEEKRSLMRCIQRRRAKSTAEVNSLNWA